jgi:hypothetical protein
MIGNLFLVLQCPFRIVIFHILGDSSSIGIVSKGKSKCELPEKQSRNKFVKYVLP